MSIGHLISNFPLILRLTYCLFKFCPSFLFLLLLCCFCLLHWTLMIYIYVFLISCVMLRSKTICGFAKLNYSNAHYTSYKVFIIRNNFWWFNLYFRLCVYQNKKPSCLSTPHRLVYLQLKVPLDLHFNDFLKAISRFTNWNMSTCIN